MSPVKVARNSEMKTDLAHITASDPAQAHCSNAQHPTRLKTGKNQPRFTDARRKVYEQYQYFLDQGNGPTSSCLDRDSW